MSGNSYSDLIKGLLRDSKNDRSEEPMIKALWSKFDATKMKIPHHATNCSNFFNINPLHLILTTTLLVRSIRTIRIVVTHPGQWHAFSRRSSAGKLVWAAHFDLYNWKYNLHQGDFHFCKIPLSASVTVSSVWLIMKKYGRTNCQMKRKLWLSRGNMWPR